MRLPSVPEAKRWLAPSLHLTGWRVSYELLLIKRTNYSPLLSATFIGQRCNLGFTNEDVTQIEGINGDGGLHEPWVFFCSKSKVSKSCTNRVPIKTRIQWADNVAKCQDESSHWVSMYAPKKIVFFKKHQKWNGFRNSQACLNQDMPCKSSCLVNWAVSLAVYWINIGCAALIERFV